MMTERASILLVDDKPERLLTYEVILESLGHNLARPTTISCGMVRCRAVHTLCRTAPPGCGWTVLEPQSRGCRRKAPVDPRCGPARGQDLDEKGLPGALSVLRCRS